MVSVKLSYIKWLSVSNRMCEYNKLKLNTLRTLYSSYLIVYVIYYVEYVYYMHENTINFYVQLYYVYVKRQE